MAQTGTTDLGATIGGSGVTSLNGLTGALSLLAGSGITITPAGSNITIAATGVAALTNAHLFVGNASNIATDVAVSGDLTLANTGAFTIANLVVTNAKIANATIDLTTKVTGVLPIANGGTNNSSAYTSGSVIFSNGTSLTQDNANFFWNDTNFSLGIGMSTPASNAFIDGVNSSGATKRVQVTGYGNNVGFRGKYANGTLGSPTAAVNTNVLAFLSAQGYGTTGFSAASTALINMTAAGTFTDSSMPTDVNILTTPTGSITAVQVALFSHTGAATLGPTSSTAIHQINGGINRTIRTITANLTVDTTTTDDIIYCNAAGAITVTLPTPTAGRVLTIKDISGGATTNNITIARHAAENIEGLASSYVIQVSYETVIISSDGTNWWIIG